ncbi:MAG: hypothetical protein OEU26_01900 [Candidatus Tectomicrobia bacterium]|nr:hypothetical protein [Candidatus Tectomicrobia bacterium]
MDCEAFRIWMDQAGAESVEPMPPALRQHGDTCVDCQSWQQAEAAWRRLFAAVPQASLTHSLWPGVRARLAAHAAPVASLSDELTALGRLLVPALALLVLSLAGVGWWSGPDTQPTPIDTSTFLVANPSAELAFLSQDPDTILQQWGGRETP